MRIVLTASMVLALGASAALAADLPSRRAPPVFVPPPIPTFTWTGIEAGLHSAYTFATGNSVTTSPAINGHPAFLKTEKDHFAQVGAGIGYNYQLTPGNGVVIGAHVDADWVDLRKTTFFGPQGSVSAYHQRLSWLGTANGRIGYAFDRFLVYGTGGFAFGDPGLGGTFFAPTGAVRAVGGNNGGLKGGYDFGGGAAYALPPGGFLDKFSIERYLGLERLIGPFSTTIKVEYIHYDLGTQAVGLVGIGGPSYTLRYHTEGNQVRAGLVYTLGSAPAVPVVARY